MARTITNYASVDYRSGNQTEKSALFYLLQ